MAELEDDALAMETEMACRYVKNIMVFLATKAWADNIHDRGFMQSMDLWT